MLIYAELNSETRKGRSDPARISMLNPERNIC